MLDDDQMQTASQPIDIVGQPEHEGLQVLRQRRAARGTVRELPLDRRDDGFHQRPLAIERTREATPHLRADATQAPGRLAPRRGKGAPPPSMSRMKRWVRSLSNSASATTAPVGTTALASVATGRRVAESFVGPCRARGARITRRGTSTAISHLHQCRHVPP